MVELVRHYIFNMWVSVYPIKSVQNLLQMNFQHHFLIQASGFFLLCMHTGFPIISFYYTLSSMDKRINLYWAS